ncbi:DUF4190 domain-containing protein [Nocardioides sp. C4-1]|uniref:DUF4190 domain-containing protein n=1 Tax=Nocardioides sp. C4-1 TaxID=3151851 RepID=UPI003262FF29
MAAPDDTPDFLAKPAAPSSDAETQPFPATPVPPSGGPSGPGPEPTTPYTQHVHHEPAQPPYAPYAPYAPVPGMPGYPFAQPHGGANVAMGLGIASLVCAVTTPFFCFTMVGVLCGPFAIVLGARARGDMSREPGRYSNEGAAMAGLVTGIIGTVLGLAMIALVVLFLGAVFGGLGALS